jgi:hypothetical protein
MAESASKNVCYTQDLDTRSRSGLTVERASPYVCILAGPLASGVRGAGPFLSPFASLLDDVHQSHRSHAQTAHSAQPRSSTPGRSRDLLPALGQQTIDSNNTLPCPALRAILSELRTGRRRFDGRCFRCSKTGCALHTGYADYEEREHWHTEADGGGLAAGFMPSAI